jgi:hypothetical protein
MSAIDFSMDLAGGYEGRPGKDRAERQVPAVQDVLIG